MVYILWLVPRPSGLPQSHESVETTFLILHTERVHDVASIQSRVVDVTIDLNPILVVVGHLDRPVAEVEPVLSYAVVRLHRVVGQLDSHLLEVEADEGVGAAIHLRLVAGGAAVVDEVFQVGLVIEY